MKSLHYGVLEGVRNSSVIPLLSLLQEADIKLQGKFAELWKSVSKNVKSLKLLNAELGHSDFNSLLQQCSNVEDLRLDGLAHLFMAGRY